MLALLNRAGIANENESHKKPSVLRRRVRRWRLILMSNPSQTGIAGTDVLVLVPLPSLIPTTWLGGCR